MLTATGLDNGPATRSKCPVFSAMASGMSCHSSLAGPMSTATIPLSAREAESVPAKVSKTNRVFTGIVHDHVRHTARAVTAGRHHTAVGIAHRHEGIAVALGRLDNQQLIEPHPGAPVSHGLDLCRAQFMGPGAGIQDNEIVAVSVHLAKGQTLDG